MLEKKVIELLAPAGCFASLQAAIDAGADAVYFGLSQLNMRSRARRSFDTKDLPELMKRCIEGGVKGFLTLNTLLYDHDLRLTQHMIDHAVQSGVHGLIVADMAAIQMALKADLEVHISTQLSISNYESFKFYSQFSDRIVLARELTLSNIKHISDKIIEDDLRGPNGKVMEIEAFAHGALCVAISGRCGMSLFTSNGSANRGACEQNCRKSYEVIDKETGKSLVLDNEFIMSPNDIATIDFLDEFLASGVNVLKIEGRGRSPEYVYTVITAYRKAIDAVKDSSYNQEFVQELYTDLESVYNRGLSSGYYLGREQGWSEAYGTKATHRKLEVGKITNYFSKIGVAEITVTSAALSKGDKFAIIGETTGVVNGVAEEMRLDNKIVATVKSGDVFSIKIDTKVRRSDKIYSMLEIV